MGPLRAEHAHVCEQRRRAHGARAYSVAQNAGCTPLELANITVAHHTPCHQAPVACQKLAIANCDTQELATATVSGRRCTPSPLTEAAGLLPVTRAAGHYCSIHSCPWRVPHRLLRVQTKRLLRQCTHTRVRRFLPLSRCARPQTALALQSSLHNIGWTLFLVVAYLMVQIVCKAYKACPRAVPLSAPRPRHEPAATATHAKITCSTRHRGRAGVLRVVILPSPPWRWHTKQVCLKRHGAC